MNALWNFCFLMKKHSIMEYIGAAILLVSCVFISIFKENHEDDDDNDNDANAIYSIIFLCYELQFCIL